MGMSQYRRVAYSGQHQCQTEIYYFWVFSIKNLYVLCFLMYTYYKKTLVVYGFALAGRYLEKVLGQPKIF